MSHHCWHGQHHIGQQQQERHAVQLLPAHAHLRCVRRALPLRHAPAPGGQIAAAALAGLKDPHIAQVRHVLLHCQRSNVAQHQHQGLLNGLLKVW